MANKAVRSDQVGFSIQFKTMPSFIPRSGYDFQPNVAARRLRWEQADKRGRNPDGVEADLEFDTQGSRGGNPGLEVVTASR